MTVDSYLELFTTLYGWALAGVFRDILIDTGVVYAPFALILGETWLTSHKSSSYEGADAAWMVRVMEAELFTAFFVIALCFVPLFPISNVSLKHTPQADARNPSPTTATAKNPDSKGFAAAFPAPPASVDIPAWWYAIMGWSGAFNEAVRGGISGAHSNLSLVQELGQQLTIADPALRREIARFYNECFVPARTKFMDGKPSAAAAAAITSYGPSDPDWIGSHAFLDDPNLYAKTWAHSEVPGFALQLNGDDADMALNDVKPNWSRPNCKRWWTDSANGLKERMITQSTAGSELRSLIPSVPRLVGLSTVRQDDEIARYVRRATVPLVASEGVIEESGGGIGRTTAKSAQAVSAAIGVGLKRLETWFAAPTIKMFAQIVQPIILLAIYMFLPLILVIGRFSFQVMFLGALAIFTVKGWAAMWYIASWFYDHMLVAMYPTSLGLLDVVLQAPGIRDPDMTIVKETKQMAVNTVLVSMYIGFPLIWTAMLGWVGYRVAGSLDGVARGPINTGAEAGASGARTAGTAARGAAGAAGRGLARGLKK
ncbi:conjugal transfer protein TraG N-terminal domain-containing protein [Denitromonas iodatirespirans]|uniref:Conjugal transfer protein TraG N-terminal domain-containing protein n=1 Tax=Denitromonas iodatirespirans TaxID=2795389 RepID=A0A944D970_DENI1|nr:conjugal transfer protein TraG N-terminal domain-containing protein [Denitromonas iodatirespirans]MBT0960328.1 conjugal transfer protein TraG N-terminal domain-containing protein [Denitromonas iodatirespirans]